MKLLREVVEDTKNQSIFVKQGKYKEGWKGLWHNHDAYELVYIIKGSGQRFVGNSIEPFASGDLVLIGPDLPHTWKLHKEKTIGESIVVQLPTHIWVNVLSKLPESDDLNIFLKKASAGLYFCGRDDYWDLVEKVMQLRYFSGIELLFRFLLLCSQLSMGEHRSLSNAWYAKKSDNHRIELINSWMLENFKEPISIEGLAYKFKMSRTGFSRFYAKSTGKSCIQYLQELRIGFACNQLLTTDESVINICFDSGFNNLSSFNKIFKKLQGTTPYQYKKQHKERLI